MIERVETVLPQKRKTNLELFRVITMLLIVAHHYVVNSGLLQLAYREPTAPRAMFLLLFGAWGKIGINCFVMITGYFMCKSRMTAKKFAKLLLQIMFYRIVINGIFWVTGYEALSVKGLLRLVPVTTVADGFTGAYLVFMLCIPFINVLVQNLGQKRHFYLLVLMSFLYIFLGTVKVGFSVRMNYVSWFMVLYLFASYIRLYPNPVFDKTKLWGWLSLVCVLLCVAAVVVCGWLSQKLGKDLSYFFVVDSNTFLAFATGVCTFMFFKNLNVPYNGFVNGVAATCFGVFQIHANSATMRNWLWQDVLDNVGAYAGNWLPVHAVLSVAGVFVICAGIDWVRLRWLEKPFFEFWDKKWPGLLEGWKKLEKKLMNTLKIEN